MVEQWVMVEIDLIHKRWELISKNNGILNVASNDNERKVLSLILEDCRLHRDFGICNHYENTYREALGQLHEDCYLKCLSFDIDEDKII